MGPKKCRILPQRSTCTFVFMLKQSPVTSPIALQTAQKTLLCSLEMRQRRVVHLHCHQMLITPRMRVASMFVLCVSSRNKRAANKMSRKKNTTLHS